MAHDSEECGETKEEGCHAPNKMGKLRKLNWLNE